MKDPFKDSEHIDINLKMLLYGPPKVGKTYLALAGKKALGNKRVVYLGFERGAAWFGNEQRFPELSGFKFFECNNLREVEQAVRFLETTEHDYGLLVVDTLSMLCQLVIEKHSAGLVTTRQEWQPINHEYQLWLRRIKNLNMHIVCISHDKEVYEERTLRNGKKEAVFVGYRPEGRSFDARWFDVVGRLTMDRGNRYLHLENGAERTGMTQGPVIENPELAMWIEGDPVEESKEIAYEANTGFRDMCLKFEECDTLESLEKAGVENQEIIRSFTPEQQSHLRELYRRVHHELSVRAKVQSVVLGAGVEPMPVLGEES